MDQRSKDRWWKIGCHPNLDLTFWRQPFFFVMPSSEFCGLVWGLFVGTKFQASQFRIPRCLSETNSGWGSFSSFTSVNSWSTCYGTSSANKKQNKKKWCEGNVLWKRWWYLRTWHMDRNNFDEVHMLFVCLSARQPSVTVPYCTSCCNQLLIEGKTLNSSCTGKHNFQVKKVIKTNINL